MEANTSSKMKWSWRAGGLGLSTLVTRWMSTLDFQGAFPSVEADPASPEFQPPAIFLLWHEYIPFFLYLRGNCNISLLVSRHGDAEWIGQAARFMRFSTIRGSSSRGGVQALRELMRQDRSINLSMTPDGPIGPRRKVAMGAIFLASKIQAPLICAGIGYDRPWRIRKAWDQFAIPRPFSRACAVISEPIHVPERLGRGGLERYRLYTETVLNRLTESAEHWAETGRPVENHKTLWPQCLPLDARKFALGAPQAMDEAPRHRAA